MNAQAITEKIIEDARNAAAQTLREAAERVDRIRALAQAEAEQKHESFVKQADIQAAQMRERMLRMAELDQKKALLKVKRDVIDEVFADVYQRMQKMSVAQKQNYFERMVLSASEDGEQIIADKGDRGLFDATYIARLNAALTKAGKKPVTLSDEVRDLGGGLVLKRSGMEINCTFASVLNERRPGLESDVAAELFGSN